MTHRPGQLARAMGLGCGPCAAMSMHGLGSYDMPQRGRRRRALGEITLQSTLLLPGEIQTAMNSVDAHVHALKADIAQRLTSIMSTNEGRIFYTQWVPFVADWLGWYQQRRTGYSLQAQSDYSTGALVSALRQKAAQYNAFEHRYTQITGAQPTEVATRSQEEVARDQESTSTTTRYVWLGAGLVGIIGVGYLMQSVAKIYQARALMRNRVRRNRKKRQR